MIGEFQKEISDQNEHVCCSCRRLMRRSNLAKVFDKDKESEVWRQMEAFLTDYDPNFSSKQLLMCKNSKCFQTVVRLGTYTAKVPIYNSLKACKGSVLSPIAS
uniref:Uncharacterized protein n=1 Tax=Amphimedon queenslandica TaxID=400682 RepID=A0A1X7V3F1_AMPQE